MTEILAGVVKVSVVLSLGLLVASAMRRQSAALRHWVLASTVMCGLALPAVAIVAPQWRAALPFAAAPRATGVPVATPGSADANAGPSDAATAATGVAGAATPAPAARRAAAARDLLSLGATLWVLGVLAGVVMLAAGLTRLGWLGARARPITDARWLQIVEPLRQAYGVRAPIRLLHSDHPALLVTWGWRAPAILVPAGALHWDDARVRVVLAHELAHVARGDWTAQLAAEALRAVYWFNPLAWLACRRLRIESECACDDTVIAQGIDATDYADHLLALARVLRRHRQPSLPAPAMARPSSLEGRIRVMLNHTRNRRDLSPRARALSAAGLLALTVAVAGVQAQAPLFPLAGTAFDPSGRVLPNARIVLTNGAEQARFEVRADAAGRYAFAGVPKAEYALEASLPGFATLREPVRIEGPAEHDLRLRVGTLQETISVTDSPDLTPVTDPTAERRRDNARRAVELADRDAQACAAGPTAGAAGGKILPPKKLVHVQPVFPESVRASAIRGSVTMTAVIGTDGVVRDVADVHGPHPDLEAAAIDAVRQWRFSTTYLNCEPIEVQMTVTTSFITR